MPYTVPVLYEWHSNKCFIHLMHLLWMNADVFIHTQSQRSNVVMVTESRLDNLQ